MRWSLIERHRSPFRWGCARRRAACEADLPIEWRLLKWKLEEEAGADLPSIPVADALAECDEKPKDKPTWLLIALIPVYFIPWSVALWLLWFVAVRPH